MKTADVIVIGGGIAGASAAAEIAADGARVLLLEMESQPGYHATGRSAAMYEPSEGAPIVRALTRASYSFLSQPPEGFVEVPLLSPRGVLMLAFGGNERLTEEAKRNGYVEVDAAFARAKLPLAKLDDASSILWDGSAQDIDVDALHAGRLRALRRAKGEIVNDAPVRRGQRAGGVWRLEAGGGTYEAPTIVDAAGAWSDQVAQSCGVAPVGLQPKRRSAAIIAGPAGVSVSDWPEVLPIDISFYCKPMGGKLMLSPAEEEPVEPHDTWADDLRLAEAAAGLERLVDMQVHRLERTWGGLRTFAPDGLPVVGFDPAVDGFFWLAGQGGYGIQTSPALSKLAAALIARRDMPADLAREGISTEHLSPRRFR
ncbi:NAD(P)/FAD-dependent oxidoreductase [Dongia deserti]|uniref:NAD(P)/FAD-dependent oxidoreductase n=1 Tax=Dongia deserti TaxID=2268030 RepID=UPI0025465D78|nr:FAD-binding oxidoreductase [Dongia deserti]